MTDNIGEQMKEEELHAAQPSGPFKFMLTDTVTKLVPREVVVPNWMARDGHWGDVYNALTSAQNGNMAQATERITKAMERARQFGREEAEEDKVREFRQMRQGQLWPPDEVMEGFVASHLRMFDGGQQIESGTDKEFRERVEKAEERLRAKGQL